LRVVSAPDARRKPLYRLHFFSRPRGSQPDSPCSGSALALRSHKLDLGAGPGRAAGAFLSTAGRHLTAAETHGAGAQRCDSANNAILVCAKGLSGECFTWGSIPCSAGTTCQVSDGKASCGGGQGCQDACDVGDKRCDGSGVQTCTANQNDTCADWAPAEACPSGQFCNNGACSSTPPTCPNACQVGDARCTGNATQTCEQGAGPCPTWGAATECPTKTVCQAGKCEDNCKNLCKAGDVRCSGNAIQACIEEQSSGCPLWGEPLQCPSGQTCQDGACKPDSGCKDACTDGDTKCDGDGVQTCAKGASGCLEWGATTACAKGQTCKAGKCDGACQDACKDGAKQCGAGGVQTCATGASGCLEWGAAKACPSGQSCQGGACKPTCNNACTAGQKRCQGNNLQTCKKDAQGCLGWDAGTSCASPQICDAGKCVDPGDPSQRTQQTVCARWKRDYPKASAPNFKNNPAGSCDPGSISQASIDDAITRINLYRWMIGLTPAAEDKLLSQKTQACAILQANNDGPGGGVNAHKPPSSWKCYSSDGAAASGASNLSWGVSNPAATISQYISDYRVASLGHRLWIISPTFTKTGIGMATGSGRWRVASCLYTFARGSAPRVDYVAFPPPGFVPIQAMGSRHPVKDWSFTSSKYKVSSLKEVIMVRKSDNDTQKLTPRRIGNYGHPAGLSWRPRTPKAGETYTVKFGTIYSYTVKFFDCK